MYKDFFEFDLYFPSISSVLNTMLNDSCKPYNSIEYIDYNGNSLNGLGAIFVGLQYGSRLYNFKVLNGKIVAFGLKRKCKDV